MDVDAGYVVEDHDGDNYRLMVGDSCERMAEIPDGAVDLSCYSPPFSSLYVYSPSLRDMGNNPDDDAFIDHYRFVAAELLRVTAPGRVACVHVMQLSNTKVTHGMSSLRDFRGRVIQAHVDEGWLFHGEVTVWKSPQQQAIRTHAQALLFVQLRRDSIMNRPALADYLLMFRKPGENTRPVIPDVDNDTWIDWASPVWWDIRESDTLNVQVARDDKDERHICPLQLGLIERCVRLWSNPGELVFDPFAGIGSTGVVALRYGRRSIGIELKPQYAAVAVENLRKTEWEMGQPNLFDVDLGPTVEDVRSEALG